MKNCSPDTAWSVAQARRLALMEALLRQRGLGQHLPPVTKPPDKFALFQAAYRRDRVGFVRDCLAFPEGQAPTPYQVAILEKLESEKRVAVRAPHGAGKTCVASWVILHAVLTAADIKVPVTASAWRQLTKFLWPEIHKWAGRLRWDRIGRKPFEKTELLYLSIKLGASVESFAVASNNPALIEGAHAQTILYVFDESKAIPDGTWDAAEGAFSQAGAGSSREAYALAISTPGEPSGRFYQIHARQPGFEDWFAFHVRLEDALAAGLIRQDWVEQRRKQWGEGSAVFQNRVLGEFASQDESSVIPLAWVEAANERWQALQEADAWEPFLCVGVDVAYTGEDKSVQALRHGDAIKELRAHGLEDTMQTTGRVIGVLDAAKAEALKRWEEDPKKTKRFEWGGRATVDVIGYGAGVVDRLRELGYTVDAFNAGAKAEDDRSAPLKDRSGELGFVNLRSFGWWHLRELLDPSNGATVALPPDDYLTGDLTAPKWRVTSGGKIAVESKDDIKKRLKRSTDYGDAVVEAFLPSFASGRALNIFF